MAMSAPSSAARFVRTMVCRVESAPVPARNVFPRGIASRATASTRSRSSSLSIGNSPVEPSTTNPARSVALHARRFSASRSVATSSPRNGVVTGMKTPSSSATGSLRRLACADAGLGGGQARDGDHERRARHVRHPDAVAEFHGSRLAAVLATDADLELWPRPPSSLDSKPHELADAFLIEDRERIRGHEPLLEIVRQELRDIVPAVAERHLREVVRAEREELGVLGDLLGDERGARHL